MKKAITALVFAFLLIFIFVSCSQIDRSALQAALDKSFNEEDYTAEAYNFYKQKYDNALAVMNDSGASESLIKSASDELNAAIERLASNKRANFSVLKELLDRTYNESEYTSDSYSAYAEAYALAKDVYEDKDSRQSAVNSAVKHLNDKINALIKKADVSQLEKLLIFNVDENIYTTTSYAYYKTVYDLATELCKTANDPNNKENVNDLQSYINLCCSQLNDAISKLILRGNTDKLNAAMKKAEDIINGTVEGIASNVYYSEESYNALVSMLSNVKKIAMSNDVDQSAVDGAEQDINKAISSLKKSDIRGELYDLITYVQKNYLSTKEYFTQSSYLRLHSAVNEAIDEYNSPSTTPEGIANAKKKVNEAVDALEYVIIIGTGRTDFNLSDVSLTISGYSVKLGNLLSDPGSLATYFGADGAEYVYTLTDENGKTFVLRDLSELSCSAGVLVIKRIETLPQLEPEIPDETAESSETAEEVEDTTEPTEPVEDTDVEIISEKLIKVCEISLDADENSIIDAMQKNPTEYFDRDGKTVFVYRDAYNGITLTFIYDGDNNRLDEISVKSDIAGI